MRTNQLLITHVEIEPTEPRKQLTAKQRQTSTEMNDFMRSTKLGIL